MAESILRLKVQSEEYDSKLKRAAEGLNRYIEGCRKAGGTLEHVDDGVKDFTQQLGKMETVAGGAKGKLGEMTKAFTDLTMQFNQMTEAEKRGQFGKALSSGLDELKQRIISTKQELADINSSLNNVGGSGGGGLFGGDKLSGMLQVFGGNVMTKIAGAGLNFASELGDMVQQGIELARAGEGVRIAFERLGRGDLLDGLRQATHGTVTDLELMKAAVKFNDFKLPLDELGVMLAYAQQKAKDTGQSVDYLVDSIVTGLGRKSLMILDNLGLSAAEIKEKMAETGDMTKAVGAIIRDQMSKAGDYVETAADRATQANVELENAMTRLGETFQPLSDSANSMWTSIKVGALDLLNNAIRPLIDAFTEAGRARALYENQGGDARVNRQLDRLRGIQTDSYRQGTYKAQLRNYDTQIASHEQYLKDYKAWQSDKTNVGAYDRMQAFQKQTGMKWVSDVQAHLDAFKKMRAEYVQGAKTIISPVKADINTDEAEQNVASLTKKLKELQAQRKKAIAAGDTDLSKNLAKQINQVKSDIKGLRGGGTTTTTTHQTPQQRAQESFTKAEQNYKQALEQAAMELEAGTITRAQAAQKEAQAAEQRWKAIGDARNISDSDRLRQAQDEAAANYKALAAEVKTATEHQKALDKVTRDLENANQKLATARQEMAQAKQQGDLQAYNTAKDKATAAQKEITRLEKVKVDVERGKVDLPDIPKVIEQTVNTHQGELITAEIAKEITQTINTRLGRIVTPDILESITQTINTKIGRVVTPDILESITQTINTKIGKVVTPAIAKELTQEVNVKTGKVDLKPIPTEITQKVDVEQGDMNLPTIPAEVTQTVDVETGRVNLLNIPEVIEQTVNTHQGELMTAEIAKEITQTINTRLGRIVTPDILESITQTINTKIGKVVTPAIAKELTQEVNVKTGKVDLKPIPTEITQKVDVEQGDVNLPAIPTELTQKVDVEQGDVNLPDIPKEIEQIVNTHQGELMTAEIAKEITQTINTRLGRIVTPDILESITQTINTKIGRVVTPDILESITQTINTKIGKVVTPAIAKELTQEVNVKTGKVDLKPIPTEITQKVDVEQGDVNLPTVPTELTQTVDVETGRVNLLNIPEVIEQTVNTHQGELMTADIATEITQKINTVLGNIVKPEILDEVTQTINTKVGEVITPEIAKEVTQVVNVEPGTVDLKPIPTETTTTVDFQADTRNINAAISDVKKEMDTIPVGTIKFNLDQTKLVDLTTLKTLIDEQVKNGLEIDPEATQGLFSKIQLGIDIEDTTWQDLIDKINEKLKDLGLDPIKLDLTTGETSKNGKEKKKKNPFIQTDENGNEKSSLAGVMGGMASGMSEMVSGMENLGIEIPKGFQGAISAVQGVVSILNSIMIIVQAIEAISAIDSIIPFARGGIVHAANGYVPGTTYSGDQIPAMLNAGEVVLNRSQQGVLAASLQAVGQSGEGGGGGRPYVSGELIWLGLNNYLNRSGRGEIVTSKRR